MFGGAYKKLIPLEMFLRTLSVGIQEISTIREKLFFFTDTVFFSVLQIAHNRKLISINLNEKTIFTTQKVFQVIQFIEEYNFIEEIQKYENDKNYKFDAKLNQILMDVGFFEHKYIDISDELNNCMKYLYKNDFYGHNDFSAEILSFGFWIYKSKNSNNNNNNGDVQL